MTIVKLMNSPLLSAIGEIWTMLHGFEYNFLCNTYKCPCYCKKIYIKYIHIHTYAYIICTNTCVCMYSTLFQFKFQLYVSNVEHFLWRSFALRLVCKLNWLLFLFCSLSAITGYFSFYIAKFDICDRVFLITIAVFIDMFT